MIISEWDELLWQFIERFVGEGRRQLDCVVEHQEGHIERLLQMKQ